MKHIIPKNDIGDHVMSGKCSCMPRIPTFEEMNLHGADTLFHTAFDQRHTLQEALRTVTPKHSLAYFAKYVQDLYLLHMNGNVAIDWVRGKVHEGFVKMYNHWKNQGFDVKENPIEIYSLKARGGHHLPLSKKKTI